MLVADETPTPVYRFVIVPKDAMAKYQHLPFSALLVAAESGSDGLRALEHCAAPQPGEALFRLADEWEFLSDDKACLHLQNF